MVWNDELQKPKGGTSKPQRPQKNSKNVKKGENFNNLIGEKQSKEVNDTMSKTFEDSFVS